MKQCPTCNRTYPDETLVYCLADGQLLSAPYDANATKIFPNSESATTSPSSAWRSGQAATPSQQSTSTRRIYVAGAILFLIVGATITALWVRRANREPQAAATDAKPISNLKEGVTQPEKIEVITRADLTRALGGANERIVAAGYVLSDITPDFIRGLMQKSSGFKATIVMVDPLGPGNIVCQRQRDEEGDQSNYANYTEIINKIRDFRSPAKTGSWIGDRLKVGVIDLYPTLAVVLVDNDLYVYPYPYGTAADSPVLKFTNYARSPGASGKIFDDHLNKITGYRSTVVDSKTRFLVTEDDWKRYEQADINPTHRCK